jgi:hypothetical protein
MTKSEILVIFACLKFFIGTRNDDERVMQLSKWLLQVPKGRNFHNRRQAVAQPADGNTSAVLRTEHSPHSGHRPTPVRHAERLIFDAVALFLPQKKFLLFVFLLLLRRKTNTVVERVYLFKIF